MTLLSRWLPASSLAFVLAACGAADSDNGVAAEGDPAGAATEQQGAIDAEPVGAGGGGEAPAEGDDHAPGATLPVPEGPQRPATDDSAPAEEMPGGEAVEERATEEEPVEEVVTEAEGTGEDGWISLFDGESLKGWTPKITGFELGDNHGNTFRVADGAIQVGYEQGYDDGFGGRFGHLFHETPYSSYVLQLEYRFMGEQCTAGPGWALRNSGIMIHGQDPKTMKVDQNFPVSIEVQLLGGDGENPRTTGNLCTPGTNVVMKGKLERRHCISAQSETYHGEQWVSCEVEVHGSGVVIHRINGEEVLRYEQPQLDQNDGDAKPLIVDAGDLLLTGGSISLQSESHPCEFRNIRLRVLDE